jgi:hypothetical protein
MSACRRWNEKPADEKTWTHFKSHFAAAHRQHKQMKGETAAHDGFHSANAAMTQTEEHMDESTIGAFANLATATAADKGVVAALTQANARLGKHSRGNYFRVEGIERNGPPGTARQAEPKKCQLNCKQLLLDSWLQGGKDSHKPLLQHSQTWPQNGGNSS